MKKVDERVYLQHILDAITKIDYYLSMVNQDEFFRNSLIQDGIIRQLGIIGEAVKRLPKPFRNRYKDIPWIDIAGMRDKLIHDYLGVDLYAVWTTATIDIPKLKISVGNILKNI